MKSEIFGTEKIMVSNVLDKINADSDTGTRSLFGKSNDSECVDMFVNKNRNYCVARTNIEALKLAGGNTVKQDAAITSLYVGDDVVKAVEAYNTNNV